MSLRSDFSRGRCGGLSVNGKRKRPATTTKTDPIAGPAGHETAKETVGEVSTLGATRV